MPTKLFDPLSTRARVDQVVAQVNRIAAWAQSDPLNLSGSLALPPWTTLILTAPWAAWDPPETSWNLPGYVKDANGFVHLRGLLNSGATPGLGNVVATLPAGFRPRKYHYFSTPCQTDRVSSWYVQPDGGISIQGIIPAPIVANSYYSWSGITFPAEQ